jgi:hypothetical protein
MKKKPIKDYLISFFKKKKLNIKSIIILVIILIIAIRFKKIFFLVFFFFIDVLITYLNTQIQIKSPFKIIEFSVFITTYTYGTLFGLFLIIGHLFLLPFSGKLSLYRIIINLLLFLQVIVIPLFNFLPIQTAGIIFLIIKTILDYIVNIIMFKDVGSLKKNFRRILDFLFWFFFYNTFGEVIFKLIKI